MAHYLRHRVQETSTTTGTGNMVLGGAVAGYLTFLGVMALNDTCWYCIEGIDSLGRPTGEWEIGRGTYVATNSLARTLPMTSSSGTTPLSFSAGTKRITHTILAPIANPAGVAVAQDWRDAIRAVCEDGDTMSGPLNFAPIVSVAAAATVNLAALLSNTVTVTGNTAITSFGTLPSGSERTVVFSGSPLLTYNATSMQNPGNRSIQMSPGDLIELVSLGAGNWNVKSYVPVDGVGIFVKDMTNRFNFIDNGRCLFNGRGGASTSVHAGFPADRWRLLLSGFAATAAQIIVGVQGFRNGLSLTLNTARAPAATDIFALSHRVEGSYFNAANFGSATAQPLVLSFWSCNSVAGTFPVSFNNGARNRSFISSYTQNVAGAYEYKEIQIPADVTGTWLTDNGIGLEICFPGAVGSTYKTATLNSWVAGNFYSATGLTDLVAATNVIRVTGVQLEVGYKAGTFIHLPTGIEQMEMFRYFESGDFTILNFAPIANVTSIVRFPFKNSKRTVPTVIHTNTTVSNISSGYPEGATPTSFVITIISSAAANVTYTFAGTWTADADL